MAQNGSAQRLALFLFAVCALIWRPAFAHEFWIAPHRYQVDPGAPLRADLRIGVMMKGDRVALVSDLFEAFTITRRGETTAVEGRDGDLPALSVAEAAAGLNAVVYRSKPLRADFADIAAFRRYLDYEGLDGVIARHRALGLPERDIREVYSRHAKALTQVGPATTEDRDAPSDAALEFVALDNPYAPGAERTGVALMSRGARLADHPVAVHRYDGEVRRRILRTNADGVVEIDLEGGGSFLLNAVALAPAETGDAHWSSEWASLTFGLPIVDPPPHPLDPLTRSEIIQAVRAIGRSGEATAATRVAMMTLDEPEKAEVLDWREGDPAPRRALAVIRNGVETFEAVVDLRADELASWTALPDAEPAISPAEWSLAQALVKEDPRWLAAMAARGLDDPAKIFCESLSAGFFGASGPRVLKMPCYDIDGARTHIYGRPVEGVVATVDLDRGVVTDVTDTGAVPVSRQSHELDEGAAPRLAPALRPIGIAAPGGGNVEIERNRVNWGPWAFHLGFDPRFGPVLSLVTHRDGDARRSVLYQGHLSEVFVPYMDGGAGWYFRSYMDAGEYGVGAHASALEPGLDCPDHARFVDSVTVTPLGAPRTKERVVCLFERPAATPLWRHRESLNGAHEARPSVELVVRSIPAVGNYDYVIDWVFDLRGEIAVQVGATGIDAVKGVTALTADEAEGENGALVAPGLVAVHHDHFFSFRLDLDVDGPVNAFRRARLETASAPEGSPRTSLWRLSPEPMATEGALSMRTGPELWRVANPAVRTALGHRPSYQISVGSDATSLLAADDWPQRRAAFSAETLWMTVQRRNERAAAGPYPNQSPGGGLPDWVDGESLERADVVAWATLGFHHLTRPEDWPVLPTVRQELRLRPYGFFDRSPAANVRREFAAPQEERRAEE